MKSLENLNPQQKEAVLATLGPVLILAGAGAGKTKTLTHRILHIIESGVVPSSILAITFTNKAAKEMKERVQGLISGSANLNRPISFNERPFVSTFHALGVHIIKENSHLLGIGRHFSIYDRSDSKRAVKEAIEASNLDPKQFEPGAMLNAISRQKGDGMTCTEYRARARTAGASGFYEQMVADVWEKYEAGLLKNKSLDFDDLLLKTALLLRDHPLVLKHYHSVWKYIHIDEYQDTNKVQYMIATLLAAGSVPKNICVVGDIDQMIYSWRGADMQNILNFEKDYPDAKVIVLEENYRSTQTILAAANNVIKKNRMRREKNLFTKNGIGEKIELIETYTEHEEANSIADKARELIEGLGANRNNTGKVEPEEIAVLYRANFQSRVIEEAFIKKNIPYQVLGTRFFDRKEIKDVISFLRVALNRDSVADLVRVVNVPPRGIGKATILKVVAGQASALSPSIQVKVAQFTNLLERIKSAAASELPSALIRFIIRETGMESMYKKGGAEEQEKLENLRELASVAAQYDSFAGAENENSADNAGGEAQTGLEAFLTNAALATDQDELEKKTNSVKLMTVHASKGLEFDYVFVAGMEDDLFPHKRLDEAEVSESEAEEERRLFYVAITRARKKIFLSYAQLRTIYGSQKVNSVSEFIADIGDEHIESSDVGVTGETPRGVKAIFIDF